MDTNYFERNIAGENVVSLMARITLPREITSKVVNDSFLNEPIYSGCSCETRYGDLVLRDTESLLIREKRNALTRHNDEIMLRVQEDNAKLRLGWSKLQMLRSAHLKDVLRRVVPQSWFGNFGGDISEKVDQLVNALSSLEANGVNIDLGMDKNCSVFVKTYVVVALATSAIIFSHKRQYFISLLSALAALVIDSDTLKRAVSKFIEELQVTSQGLSDFAPLINLLVTALGVNKLSKGQIKEFSSIASNYSRISDGAMDMFSECLSFLEVAVNFVREKAFGLDGIKFVESLNDEMQEWANDVDRIQSDLDRKVFQIDVVNYEKVLLLKSIGDRFCKEMAKTGKDYASIKSTVFLYQKRIQEILAPFKKASLDASCLRCPPLAVLLQGQSGVGKSAVTIPMLDQILISILDDADSLRRYLRNNMDFIYSRNYETKYWDGYRGQMVCVFDDFMQNVECMSDPDGEPMNLIRAVNPFPYQLHMAHLDDKGNNYFSSKLILATTNDFNLHSMLIKQPEALKRRFEVKLEVYPKAQYCVDPHVALKDRRLKQLETFDLDVYEFHVKTDKFGLACKEILNFSECVQFIVHCYDVKMNGGSKYISQISDRRNKLIEERLRVIESQGLKEFLIKRKADRIMAEVMTPVERDFYIMEMNLLLKRKLSYYPKAFMDEFWASLAGRSYLTRRHNPVVPMSIQNRCVLFRSQFKQFCDRKGVGCAITSNFANDVVAFGVEPQNGTQIDDGGYDHWCPSNFGLFKDQVREFGTLDDDEVTPFVASYLNCGVECPCDLFESALEMMKDSAKPRVDFYSMVSSIRERIVNSKSFPLIAGFAGILATLKTVHSLYSVWTTNLVSQYGESKTSTGARPLRDYKLVQVVSQSGNSDIDERLIKYTNSLLKRNVYVAYVNGVDQPWGYVTAIKGDIFMLNAHYYRLVKQRMAQGKETEIELIPYTNAIIGRRDVSYMVNLTNLLRSNVPSDEMLSSDTWLFRLSHMRPHRSIVDQFISTLELNAYTQHVPICSIFMRCKEGQSFGALVGSKAELVKVPLKVRDLSMKSYLRYEFPSESGDCGSLVVLRDSGYNRDKILAIHSGLESGKHALATIITKEFILKCLDNIENFISVLPNDVDPDMTYNDHGLLEIDCPHVYHRPNKTKLRKSPLHGLFGEPSREPAVLVATPAGDPYNKALERYGTGNFHVDEAILRASISHYTTLLVDKCKGDRSILSFDEAVAGIAGEKYINGVCRSTSPGYPWNLDGPSGKWHLFGADQLYDLSNDAVDKLRERCCEIVNSAKLGERLSHYYIDALKDELRSKDKIAKAKTRMISCAPLDLVVVMKRFFGAFVSAFISCRIFNGSAVGINPVSEEWTVMARFLMSKGINIIAGDFESFDATQSSTTLRGLCDIINDWYDDGEENRRIREVLWHEVYNSMHLHGKSALMFDHSLPSGNPLTTVINTMYVNVVIRMAFINCFDGRVDVINEFDNHVSLVAYGDDNILGVSDECLEYFNYSTITQSMMSFGLKYTDETKSGSNVLAKSLDQSTFLKRSFREVQGQFVAPLDLQTVLEMCYWYRNGPCVDDRISENVMSCLKELSLHDRPTWRKFSSIIKRACREKDISVPLFDQPTYNVMIDSDYAFIDIDNEESGIVVQSGVNELNTHEIAGQPDQSGETVNDATKFLSDTVVREYEPAPVMTLDNFLMRAPDVFPQDDVKQFLGRPIEIDSFSFTLANAAGDTLYSHTLPPNDMYNSVTALWSKKLAGFLGFRGTAVFRFVVAANRFVQGRILVHYLPGPSDSDWEKQHNRDLTTRTQQPRIEINVNRDTAAEIRFPYISPSTHYNIATFEGIWGRLFATCYSPLIGSVGSINVGVYLHFEDVDLALPTFVEPQSGNFRESESLGPISGPLNVFHKVAEVLKEVPSLTSIATPAAWFIDCARKTAQVFGLSVANNYDHFLRVTRYFNPYSMNNDGQRMAVPMSHSARNCIDVLPGFAGNDLDEMSLRYFASRPAFVTNLTLSTADTQGSVIGAMLVYPGYFINAAVSRALPLPLAGTAYTMPPVAFLSYLTSYWRGSLVYTFKLVKTEFHTGKIGIAFYPGISSTPTNAQSGWTMRQVVDIKDTDEFHVTVPYTALTPWKDYNSSIGQLVFYNVNPLNGPTSVSTTISVIVEVSGGDDFAVAGLRDITGGAYTDSTFTPQSGLFSDDVRIKKFIIGGAKVDMRTLHPERFCIGEPLLSVRHFVCKFTRSLGLAVANNANVTTDTKLVMKPFTVGGVFWNGTTLTPCALSGSFLSMFSSCYSLSRGSVLTSIKQQTQNFTDVGFTSTAPTAAAAPIVSSVQVANSATTFPMNSFSTIGEGDSSSQGTVVSTPQWSRGHSRYVRCDNTNGSRAPYAFEPPLALSFETQVTAGYNQGRTRLYRAAGDDFALGAFVGVPCMYIYGSISNPSCPDWKG